VNIEVGSYFGGGELATAVCGLVASVSVALQVFIQQMSRKREWGVGEPVGSLPQPQIEPPLRELA